MRRPLHEAGDHASEGQQGLVDAARLARAAATSAAPRNILAAGQINQVELAHAHHLLALYAGFLEDAAHYSIEFIY